MVWLILLAGFVLGLLVLGLAVRPLLRALLDLRRAVLRLARQAGEARTLQTGAEALQQRVAALAEQADRMQAHQAGRDGAAREVSSRNAAR